jgi:hypothetical protein
MTPERDRRDRNEPALQIDPSHFRRISFPAPGSGEGVSS